MRVGNDTSQNPHCWNNTACSAFFQDGDFSSVGARVWIFLNVRISTEYGSLQGVRISPVCVGPESVDSSRSVRISTESVDFYRSVRIPHSCSSSGSPSGSLKNVILFPVKVSTRIGSHAISSFASSFTESMQPKYQ